MDHPRNEDRKFGSDRDKSLGILEKLGIFIHGLVESVLTIYGIWYTAATLPLLLYPHPALPMIILRSTPYFVHINLHRYIAASKQGYGA